MRWRLCCLLLIAVTVFETHAKPQIEDADFSDIDLVAEESQANGIYVAAPPRTKREAQFFGNNFIYNTNSASSGDSASSSSSSPASASSSSSSSSGGGGCEGHHIYAHSNNAYSYGQNSHNGDAGASFPNYIQKQQGTLIVMVANIEHEHQSYNTLTTPQPSSSSLNSGVFSSQSSFAYSPFPQLYNHDSSPSQPPPKQEPLALQSHNDYSSGFNYYPHPPLPPPGFYGHRPYGFYPHPPYGGPHGFGPPPFRGYPGFNHRPHPHHPPHGTNPFLNPVETPTTMIPLTNIPESTQEVFVPRATSAPPTTTTTIGTTTEPTYDIDIRFGNK